MLSSKKDNEELVRKVFKNIIEADHVRENEVARFFSPDYVQHVDGHTLDYQGFIHHLHAQRKEIASMRVSFLSIVGDDHDVFTNHIVSVCKKDGTEAAIKVLAQFTIRNKKIIACDELTYMISGAAGDKNLGSRR